MTTFFACATAIGPAGMAIIRVSGPAAHSAAIALTDKPLPQMRYATRRRFIDPLTHDPLDDGLLLLFRQPASFTGEDIAEFHVHGSPAVVAAMLAALGKIADMTPAPPGGFTRQAFDNGKLDLAQVEGLADLVAAETEAQRQQALRQADGALSRCYERWREQLMTLLARLTADIDFAEGEDDIPSDVADGVRQQAAILAAEIETYIDDQAVGEKIRDGLTIAIIGTPNVGKSSLLNALVQRDVAITSPLAGTTRDVIEVALNLGGYVVNLIDTAGLRETHDPIETEGVARARTRAARADLRLVVSELQEPMPAPEAGDWWLINKIDQHPGQEPGLQDGRWYISVHENLAVDALLVALRDWAIMQLTTREAPLITRARHRHVLMATLEHLSRIKTDGQDIVLTAENLRLAAQALSRLVGRIDVEDILSLVFSSFCIGK